MHLPTWYKEGAIISRRSQRKKELDKQRNEWRKKHRILNGKVILWPDKPPEHVNARASKTYNWFWKKVLLPAKTEDIPAIISNVKEQIKNINDKRKTRVFRTMIGMAEDAYKLKKLDSILDTDTELQLGEKAVYNSEQGLIFRNGKYFTTDFSEDETKIFLRDSEGTIIDIQYNGQKDKYDRDYKRRERYENWDYINKA